MALSRFSPPGNLADLPEQGRTAWSERVSRIFARLTTDFPQFYDPTVKDTSNDHAVEVVEWPAFPATVHAQTASAEERWAVADEDRERQDEYCEWSVRRDDAGKVVSVTFTTETPEYFAHLLATDPELVRSRYADFVGHEVPLGDLLDANGDYRPRNRWNCATSGPIAHLVQNTNTLGAAVTLAAQATILRERDGELVTDQAELVACGKLGDPRRNSDPRIAAAVNGLAAKGFEITLQDPPGLYISELPTEGMTAPDGADVSEFWTVERGDADHVLRARFEVPAARGYSVGDIRIGGRPIRFGAQLADHVKVEITAVAQPGGHRPQRRPCENGD